MMGKYNCAMAYKGPKKQTLASEFRGKILEKVSMYLLLGLASCSFRKSPHFLSGLGSILYKMRIMAVPSQWKHCSDAQR